MILALPDVSSWLKAADIDVDLVAGAVAGHHLKLTNKERKDRHGRAFLLPFASQLTAGVAHLEIQQTEDLDRLFRLVAERAGIAQWSGKVPSLWGFRCGFGTSVTTLRDSLKDIAFPGLRRDEHRCRLWRAVLAALIAADSAGSGLPRTGKNIVQWIADTFDEPPLTGTQIRQKVIQPRISEIEEKKRATNPAFNFAWQDFQTAADHLSQRALLLAGCGAGKTLAAWRWIAARLDERPAARVIFLYPTRATATEGFRDYVSHAPEGSLISGTAAYELDGMFQNPEDDRSRRSYETDDRLYALGFWKKRVFSATVDQFLGFFQLSYRSLCLLPVLADSVVVIDEVHSFDHRLWSALKTMLKEFQAPVLCMTASLPKPRRDELVNECKLELYPGPGQVFDDLEYSANLRRYSFKAIAGEAEAKTIARKALAEKKRVLWVVNTVNRCQNLARELDAVCYHSRFTLEDRKTRHRQVVAAFQPGGSPDGVIALTTQVCEMSLDLDADVLITELAPIPSLIQRMERCNRYAQDEWPPGQVYCYEAEGELPYKKEEMVPARMLHNDLNGKTVSQVHLEEELDARTRLDARTADAWIQFVEGVPWAAAGEEDLRDSHDFTVNVIFDRDLELVLELRKAREPIDGYICPVPRLYARPEARLAPMLYLASKDQYHPQFGFLKEAVHGQQE